MSSETQFYRLSKHHHPDRNQDDPTAAERFVRISEAYAVLGSPKKREQYDRDLRASEPAPHGWSSHSRSHSGSRAQPGPAGGRPASGLSRRRGQFKGPPPSFYRSGGWGAHEGKRQAAADATAAAAAASATASASSDSATREGTSTKKVFIDENDVPHFDRESHLRTQRRQEEHRMRRMADDIEPVEHGPGMLRNFVFVSGILVISFAVPATLVGILWGTPGSGQA
ncbi:MAG: hypothetical protein M1815_005127 [Lichina confinis]|nr:MAG: hypothetical protein M1815_005127 [Lichina confinis]